MKPLMKTALIASAALVGGIIITKAYAAIAAKTEEQPYQVIKEEAGFEIRRYPSATMATVSMEATTYKELSSPGFRKLASFIFGGNNDKKSIAMTAPVHMDINDSGSSMSFVMPATYTKDNLPKPDDSAVRIETTAPEYVAAIRFGGYANDEKIKKYAAKLKKALQETGIESSGNFRFLGYDAPYQFLKRRNEIIVSVNWNA